MSSTPDSVTSTAAPADGDSADLDTAVAALRRQGPPFAATARHPQSSRRALLGVVLSALLVGGVFAVVTAHPESRPDAASSDDVYLSAHPGSCLAWQPDQPDRPAFVQCTSPHLFEVARGVDAVAGEACDVAVRRYLGDHFDPNSKFAVAELSTGGTDRKALCGLQLPGPDGHLIPFHGVIAQTDQSKVWPPGTCLGSDPKTSAATDTATDCAAPHAVEVIGVVDLGEKFHGAAPADTDQTAELHDACNSIATAYLTPKTPASMGLSVKYHAIDAASWNAGSRQAVCSLGPKSPQPMTGPAKSHHPAADENDSTPIESAPRIEASHGHPIEPEPASPVTHASQPAEIVPAPTTSDGAHEVVQIPGLAPITVPVMPEAPDAGLVPLAP